MKKIFDKIKNWALENKGFALIVGLALIFLIIIIIITIQLLVGGSSNKYGSRLDGINKVKIASDTYKEVEEEIKENDGVEEVETRLQGKIVYTTITFSSDVSADKAKEIASNTLDNYSEEELSFYDFSYFLKWKGEEEDTVITGNKHHNNDTIAWVKS